jgi:hypothetical protein
MIKRNRLVALFDILGFTSRLNTDDLASIRKELRLFIRTIRSEAFTNTARNNPAADIDNLEVARFVFDSVVLISHNINDSRNVHNFVFACIRLLELGFVYRFPFRGSIALGDVFTDEETGLILGPQLATLRDAERMQDWSGCFLHPPAAVVACESIIGTKDFDRTTRTPGAGQPLHLLEVPLKKEFEGLKPFRRWCLNWAYLLDQRTIKPSLEYLQADAQKHVNTKRYVDYVRSLPNNLTPPVDGAGVPPGTMAKFLASRWGLRLLFVNQNGEGVKMPGGTLHWEVRSVDSDFSEGGADKLSEDT